MDRRRRNADAAGRSVTGAIIAGGRSRRMGADKRGLHVDGVPMLRRVALAVASAIAGGEILVACRPDDPPDPRILAGLATRIVHDRVADAGPLAGLEAVLAAAPDDLVLVVAADMPWLDPAVLRLLVAEAGARPADRAVVLQTERGPEPLVAVYRRDVLPIVTRLLDDGVRRMHALLDEIRPVEMPMDRWQRLDPGGLTARNANEPGDLPGAGTGAER